MSYLEDWQGLKRLTDTCLAWVKQSDLKPRCLHRNKEHSPQPPNGVDDPAEIMSPTPTLWIWIQSYAHHTCLPQVAHELLVWDAKRPLPLYFLCYFYVSLITHLPKCYLDSVTSTTLTNVMSCLATRRQFGGHRCAELSVARTGSNHFEPDFYFLYLMQLILLLEEIWSNKRSNFSSNG